MMYGMAAQQGIGAAQLLLTGENAATKGAYNAKYQEIAQRYAISDALNQAENNISSVKQDKILSDVNIELSQQQAEAQAKVASAVAGVSGTNIDQTIYQTEVNESMSKQQNAQAAQQAIEQQKTAVKNASIGLSNIQEAAEPSILDVILPAAGSLSRDDFKLSDEISNLWSN